MCGHTLLVQTKSQTNSSIKNSNNKGNSNPQRFRDEGGSILFLAGVCVCVCVCVCARCVCVRGTGEETGFGH